MRPLVSRNPRPSTGRRKRARECLAYTLIEALVAMGIGSMILASMAAFFAYGSQSFVALGNYMELDRYSRAALDQMTRDIRQTISLHNYATNQLVFIDYDTNWLVFTWNPSTGKLTRSKAGTTTELLTQCDYLCFRIFQRNPMPGQFDFYPATNLSGVYDPTLCKLVDVSWRCSRSILGKKINTESVQTAKIVLRN